ncbi:hypothetical protein B0J12DRAFT_30504 [Macrophomina phaseolina]|uniref:Secreted protein n=1 Tax=Macrophomina phaseolina TaxID=35725 RepID=A0ABQ8GVL9_9PEZI|nr:hypothetical protein B0J12DRAFT_30504 [Macrophomina phaseolina]
MSQHDFSRFFFFSFFLFQHCHGFHLRVVSLVAVFASGGRSKGFLLGGPASARARACVCAWLFLVTPYYCYTTATTTTFSLIKTQTHRQIAAKHKRNSAQQERKRRFSCSNNIPPSREACSVPFFFLLLRQQSSIRTLLFLFLAPLHTVGDKGIKAPGVTRDACSRLAWGNP